MTYLDIKMLHILSMVLLFGTGFGSAFYKWMADLSGNVQHIAVCNRHVVLADWWFTTPTIIIQPLTGLWMLQLTGVALDTPWVLASLVLYGLAGACWLPVVWLQLRMKQLSAIAAASNQALPSDYWRYARIWFWLGVPAFIAMLLIVYLMINKPALGA